MVNRVTLTTDCGSRIPRQLVTLCLKSGSRENRGTVSEGCFWELLILPYFLILDPIMEYPFKMLLPKLMTQVRILEVMVEGENQP